jgi:hypothetical protein
MTPGIDQEARECLSGTNQGEGAGFGYTFI